MNVLQISESDAGGGAARTALRLHRELRRSGHAARMLVGRRQTADGDVRLLKRGPGWRAADRACSSLLDPLGLQYVLYPSSFGVAGDPWFRQADVVQLHNTHGSYFSHTALPFLSRRKPVVWFLHDQWALTGHVAYSLDCERWRHGCGSCPYLAEYPALPRDTSAALWRWKRTVYRHARLTLVTPSRWLAQLAGESPLLRRFRIEVVPNGVDLSVFRPAPRPTDRPTVLFAAADLADRRKGASVLREALARLGDLDFDLAVAGGRPPDLGRPVRALGRLDEPGMAAAYAAADVFVLPSLAENLSNALVEALACATPCLAFDVGGNPDLVRHGKTGLLVPPGDAGALAASLRRLLSDAELRGRLGDGARRLAERELSIELQARRLAALYGELLAG